jgi:hypothetical protein
VKKFEDANIQILAIVAAYRTPSMKTRDARVLEYDFFNIKRWKKLEIVQEIVDDKKNGFVNWCFSNNQEDYGSYIIYGLPQAPNTVGTILAEIDAEIVKLQTELISEKISTKLQTSSKKNHVNSNL